MERVNQKRRGEGYATLNFQAPVSLVAAVRREAGREGVTMAAYARRTLAAAVEQEKK
jgi:hypothetical protein